MKDRVIITSASALVLFLVIKPVFAAPFPANIPGPSVGRDTDGPSPFIYMVSEQRGEELRSKLSDQGYTVLNQDRTWLGRYRFIVRLNAQIREIIVHQHTGAILRNILIETHDPQSSGQASGAVEDPANELSGGAIGGGGGGGGGLGVDVDIGGSGGIGVDVDIGGGGIGIDLGL